jgi:hypothetical protein
MLTEKLDQLIREENTKVQTECLQAGFQNASCVFQAINGEKGKGKLGIIMDVADWQLDARLCKIRDEAIRRFLKRLETMVLYPDLLDDES